jgi:hypothetical protein
MTKSPVSIVPAQRSGFRRYSWWGWMWRIAAGLGVVFLVLWLVAWWITSSRLARAEAALVAAGAPMDLAALLGPEPAAAGNGAVEWQRAIAGLPEVLPGDERTTRDRLVRAAKDPAQVQARIKPFQERLDWFAQGAAKSVVRMPLEWSKGIEMHLSHLHPLRYLTQLTLLRGAVAWGKDPVAGGPVALEAITTVHQAGARLAEEPTLISHFTGLDLRGQALHLLWLITRDPNQVTVDLAPLRRQLLEAPSTADSIRALDGERLGFGRTIFQLAGGYDLVASAENRGVIQRLLWSPWLSPLRYPLRMNDEAFYLETMASWRSQFSHATSWNSEFYDIDLTPAMTHPLSDIALPSMKGVVSRRGLMNIEISLAVAAIDTEEASRAAGRLVPAATLPPGISVETTPRGLVLKGTNGEGITRRWPMGPGAMDVPAALAGSVAPDESEEPDPSGPVKF